MRAWGAVLACVGVLVAGLLTPAAAGAEAVPAGLSDAHRAMFEEYDTKMAAAIRRAQAEGMTARAAATEFPKQYGLAVLADVFGEDWAPIKAYADAALAGLPAVDPGVIAGKEPIKTVDMSEAERLLGESLSKAREFEAGLATARLWEPASVAGLAAGMVLGRTTPELVAHHSVTGGYNSERLAKTTWRGRPALILFKGGYIFVATYMRTPRGLIWATEIGMYER